MSESNGMSVRPLRNKTLKTGKTYVRDKEDEALILELLRMPRSDVIKRCEISSRGDDGYVPSECLLHLLRISDAESDFEALFRILAERVLRRLPKKDDHDLSRSNIRDEAFGKFAELLARDRNSYELRLDYFEVRFDASLKSIILDARKKVWRDQNRFKHVETDTETGELPAWVEEAGRVFNPFDSQKIGIPIYRSELNAAIDSLPDEQKQVVLMLQNEIPIDSKDSNVDSISKLLGMSEKTIRTYKALAFASLRKTLEGELVP